MLSQQSGNSETGSMEYPFGRGINLQMFVDSINPILRSLTSHSYPLMKAPFENSYRKDNEYVKQREFLVQDPDGYLLRFAECLSGHYGGQPVSIERKGEIVQLVPVKKKKKLDNLKIRSFSDEPLSNFDHIDWSDEWTENKS